jgi:hypothetical protein
MVVGWGPSSGDLDASPMWTRHTSARSPFNERQSHADI